MVRKDLNDDLDVKSTFQQIFSFQLKLRNCPNYLNDEIRNWNETAGILKDVKLKTWTTCSNFTILIDDPIDMYLSYFT